tara:strand:+ start:603 stop:809 length:207 start_codon:yes stop_codon:yes gene_type:complete
MQRDIDYEKLLYNTREMINTLEYDAMRSGGKTKLNCDKLYYLYFLEEKYSKMLEKNSKKPTTKNKEVS